MKTDRIVLLAQPGASTNILYHAVNRVHPIDAVILEAPEAKKKFIERRIRRLGYREVAGQLAFMVYQKLVLKARARDRRAAIMEAEQLNQGPIPEDKITRVASCNSQECREVLAATDPRLVLINGTRIIGKKTIGHCGCPLVNLHAGITPKYRGVHGGYWALKNGEPELCGVSLHVIDEGIDTGAVIDQSLIEPTAEDEFLTYPLLQLSAGLRLLKKHLPDLLAGRVTVKPPLTDESKLWYHPTLSNYLSGPVR